MVCVLCSVITSKFSGNSHVSDKSLHDGENGGRTLIAGAVWALEAGGAVHKHYDVSRSPERCRERARGVNVDKLHRPVGARRLIVGMGEGDIEMVNIYDLTVCSGARASDHTLTLL